jgi:signal transduction histidine kinase
LLLWTTIPTWLLPCARCWRKRHNAIQHADASEIAVRLTRYPDRLRLTVTDDGRGIVGGVEPVHFVAQGHFGLAGMRERAAMIGARLDVQTAADYGTVVILELPR